MGTRRHRPTGISREGHRVPQPSGLPIAADADYPSWSVRRYAAKRPGGLFAREPSEPATTAMILGGQLTPCRGLPVRAFRDNGGTSAGTTPGGNRLSRESATANTSGLCGCLAHVVSVARKGTACILHRPEVFLTSKSSAPGGLPWDASPAIGPAEGPFNGAKVKPHPDTVEWLKATPHEAALAPGSVRLGAILLPFLHLKGGPLDHTSTGAPSEVGQKRGGPPILMASFPSEEHPVAHSAGCSLDHQQGGSLASRAELTQAESQQPSDPPILLGGQGHDMRDITISGLIFGICVVIAVILGLVLTIHSLLRTE